MANSSRGEVELKANGSTYCMKFTANEMASFDRAARAAGEYRTCLSMASGLGSDAISLDDVIALGHVALRAKHPDLKPEDVGNIMDDVGHPEFLKSLGDAFAAVYEIPNPTKAATKTSG